MPIDFYLMENIYNMEILKRRLSFLIVPLSSAFFTPIALSATTTYSDTFNDWVYSTRPSVCGGYYLPPKFAPNTPDIQEAPTEIGADYNSIALQGVSTLTGNVEIERGTFRLTSDQLSFYRDSQTKNVEYATAQGHVLVEEPSARLYGTEANIDLLKEQIEIQNAQYRVYSAHGRGSASSISQQRNYPLYLNDVTYTTCAPDDNFWEIRAKTVSLDQESNRGVARDAWVYIKDVPIAYSPYLSFPLSKERKSGLLAPSYVNSTNAGFEFSQPYYFNLAPNYDDTLTANWYSKRGFQLQNEFRYLLNSNEGVFYAEWLPDDPEFAHFQETNLMGAPDSHDPRTEALRSASTDRQAVYFNQEGQLSSQWLMNVNFEYVSDDNYLSDLNPQYFDLNNRTLEREIETEYFSKNWSLYGRALDYQNLQPFDASIQQESYNVLPQFFLMGEYPDDDTGLHYGLLTQASIFTHDNALFTDDPVTQGNRYGLTPEISWPWRSSYGYINPRAQLSFMDYDLNLGTTDEEINNPENPTRTLPIIDIDSGLFFDRSLSLFGNNYSQSLEPRLFYLYVPNRNQNDLPNFDSELMEFNFRQLFRTNRFSGYDRIGDANQLSYAATSRFTNTSTGKERARVSLGQILYFEDREVTTCDTEIVPNCINDEDPTHDRDYSPFVSEFYYYITDNWSGLVELQWDPNTVTSLEQRRLQIDYQDEHNRLLSLGYSFIAQGNPDPDQPFDSSQNNLEQVDAAFGLQILPRWNVLAGIEYDMTNKFAVESFAGVEYENCCWAIRAGTQRYLTINSNENDQQFDEEYFIQFSLKGLASVGNSPGGLFSNELQGYKDSFGTRY
jgi:LPS-assembly protein